MYRVIISRAARSDLAEVKAWISSGSSGRTASQFLLRLQAFLAEFAMAPHRGQHRHGIPRHQRTIGFERKASIIFTVDEEQQVVRVVAVRYGGKQL